MFPKRHSKTKVLSSNTSERVILNTGAEKIISDFKIGKLKHRGKQTLFLLLKKIKNNNRLDQSSSFIEKRPNI